MNRREFFDRHARKWDGLAKQDVSARLARVVAESGTRPGDHVLDVGTGTGVLIPHILTAVGEKGRVLALDISPEMLTIAEEKGFPENVEFLEADMQESGLPDRSFDRVICNAAFPHFMDKHRALTEMVRVLRPGGTLTISHPIGREAVNNLHREVSDVVAEDRVPSAEKMRSMLEAVGLTEVSVTDESNYYSAVGNLRA